VTGTGFDVAVPMRLNQANALTVVAVGGAGLGLASAPVPARVVHDNIAPIIVTATDPSPNLAG
jgi:hypothetical protein